MRTTNKSELSIIEAVVAVKIEKLGLILEEANRTKNVVELRFTNHVGIYYFRPNGWNMYDLHYNKNYRNQTRKYNHFSELYQFLKTILNEIVE